MAGLAVLVIVIPINSVIANKVKKLQMKQLKFKDERVKVVNEVLNGIKVRQINFLDSLNLCLNTYDFGNN